MDVVWTMKEFNYVRVIESAAEKYNARTIGLGKKKEIRVILIS